MMTKTRFKFHRFLGPVGLLLLLAGCGKDVSTDSFVYKMGDKVPVGTMIYTVIETEWRSDLSGAEGLPQTPKNRFLLLKVSMTNSGGAQAAIPLLTLENTKKEAAMEVGEVKNLPGWLGMVRLVNPAQTEEGMIVFDVPPAAYKLRVTDGKESGSETTRLIDIPLSLNEPIRTN
jgi:hypothetical protein